jgi:cytochrome c oxidase assembly protein subunit 15
LYLTSQSKGRRIVQPNVRADAPSGSREAGGRPAVPAFARLGALTCAVTYALIVLGGVVRTTGSGDACPDWPRCKGELLPPLETGVLIEFSHRLVASGVGLLVLATAIVAWRTQRDRPVVFWGALLAVGLVVAQIGLGGATVLSDLSPNVVMAHLALATALLATLLVVTGWSLPWRPAERPERRAEALSLRNLALAAGLAVFALMMTGSYVSGSGAGLAFRDWPLFDGGLMPDGGRLAVIHAMHRFAALVVGLGLMHVAAKAWRLREAHPVAVAGVLLALVLYGAQVIVGAANIWTLLKPAAVASHLALAVAVVAALTVSALFAHRTAAPERHEARRRAPAVVGRPAEAPAGGGS